MESVSRVDPGAATHPARVAELSRKLAALLSCPTKDVFAVCDDFDNAVEFAALEGKPVSEAIADFVKEGWVLEGPERDALARLSGCADSVDICRLSLPVMPKQAFRLLRTSNEDTSAAELEQITGSDPVMTGSLLGAANSALFGSQGEIVRLLDAIMRVGVPESRKILLASCIAGIFASKPLQELWEHSQAVANAAHELALMAGIDAETAYVAGLLHDIGRLGFTRLPARMRIAEQEWLTAGFPGVYAETLAYGMDHAALGAEILRRWKLPEGLVEAVALHHRPERSDTPLNSLITLAEDVTARAAGRHSEDLWQDMRRTSACVKTGFSLEQIEDFESDRSLLLATA